MEIPHHTKLHSLFGVFTYPLMYRKRKWKNTFQQFSHFWTAVSITHLYTGKGSSIYKTLPAQSSQHTLGVLTTVAIHAYGDFSSLCAAISFILLDFLGYIKTTIPR